METNEFKDIIGRYLDGNASDTERQMVENYLNSFPMPDWNEAEMGEYDTVKANLWQRIEEQTIEPKKKPAPIRWIRWAAAAAIISLISITAIFLLQPSKDKSPVTAQIIHDIQPGLKKAYITLGNGQHVELDTVKPGQRIGNAVMGSDGKLIYDESTTEAIALNTVTVPRGGTPRFVELPDHTLVWINTASSITYPTAFTGNTREVKMTGQVYYEVAKESNGRKLFAQTRTDRIEVKGTHFDIRAYDDEPFVQTTLFEGSVQIGSKLLTPGDQYENGNIKKLKQTDLDRVIAWKNGLFSYDKVDVQTLMRDLGRYYDVDVLFEGQPTKRVFEGKIGRSLTLKEVLEGLQFTELNYRLEKGEKGNRIVMLP